MSSLSVECQKCHAKLRANGKLGDEITCPRCLSGVTISPSFNHIPDLSSHEKVIPTPVIRDIIEVEIESVPFWLMLLQGFQIAVLLACITWLLLPTSNKIYNKARAAEAEKVLQEKENKDSIRWRYNDGM